MKKIIIALSCILVISISILNYQCQETFIKVSTVATREKETTLPVKIDVEKQSQNLKTSKKKGM